MQEHGGDFAADRGIGISNVASTIRDDERNALTCNRRVFRRELAQRRKAIDEAKSTIYVDN